MRCDNLIRSTLMFFLKKATIRPKDGKKDAQIDPEKTLQTPKAVTLGNRFMQP